MIDNEIIKADEKCPYCHEDNEGYVKMFGNFYLRKDHFNGWNLYAGKGKTLPIKYCPMCGRKLVKENIQVNSIQDDFCGVPCDFMQNIIDSQKTEIERLKEQVKFADNYMNNLDKPLQEFRAEAKAEAYKEFAERLKKELYSDSCRLVFESDLNIFECAIDNLLKEMEG